MSFMPKHLYLPIEIGSRELGAKLLTAASAVERGFTVILGFQYHLFMNNARLPPGLFFSKGSNRLFLHFVDNLRKNGHAFVASEEENYGYCLNEAPVAFNPQELPDKCDLYLCLGASEARYLDRRFGSSLHKAITGNARSDFLRPRLRSLFTSAVADIRERYGRHILLNMNFGVTNPNAHSSLQKIFELWVKGGIFVTEDPAERVSQFQEFVQWENDNSAQMQMLVALLSKRTTPVVIRPHPSESAESWRKFVAQFEAPHIHVLDGTPLIPYMLACDVMVHPGCTTGMEALALGVPTICMNAGLTKVPHYYVSPKVNAGTTTAEEAVDLIDMHWKGSDVLTRDKAAQMARLADYVADLDGDVLTADRIVETLDRFAVGREFSEDGRTIANIAWKTVEDGSPEFNATHAYRLSKFAVASKDVDETLRGFRQALGRFHGVRAEEVYEGVYLVHGASAAAF